MADLQEPTHFVVCIRNEGCDDLQLRKLYPVLPDDSAARSGYIRVIDESGEDYLYPEGNFLRLDLPGVVEETLAALPIAQ